MDMIEAQVTQRRARDQGVPALRRLVKIAQGHSGQCRYVAMFLLGLYNGPRFPFDLTVLRALDTSIFEDCMLVLHMDSCPAQEVHCYIEDGSRVFEALARDWGIESKHGY